MIIVGKSGENRQKVAQSWKKLGNVTHSGEKWLGVGNSGKSQKKWE